jgi:hypothetical protein
MTKNLELTKEAKAWIKRKSGPDEIIRVVRDTGNSSKVLIYNLYTAFNENPDYLGRILFDAQNYWIYDGDIFTIAEQEQLAKFILNYADDLTR